MSGALKWVVVPAVLMGVLAIAAPSTAQAGPWSVHVGVGWGYPGYWGGFYPHGVFHPGHFHYYPGHIHVSPWSTYYYPGYYYHPGHFHFHCD